MSNEPYRKVYRSKDGKIEISTNIPGFKWPTREDKIAGLLDAGLIDQADANRLRALVDKKVGNPNINGLKPNP